jgi:hypothetical protein
MAIAVRNGITYSECLDLSLGDIIDMINLIGGGEWEQ